MDSQVSGWQPSLSDWTNLVELLDARADEHGNTDFATFPEETLTYGELAERSERIAAGFDEIGVGAGDRIVVMMYNRSEFLPVYFGALRAGAVLVPLNVSLRGDDLEYTLTDADPSVAIIGDECLENYREVEDDVDVAHRYCVGTEADGFEPLGALRASGDPPSPDATQADAATIIYTSGTTGMPKGVVLPHGAFLTVATEIADRIVKPTDDDVLYMSQPLFHIFAQMVVTEALVASVPFAMERWFSKSKFWDRVRSHDATIIHFSSAISEILYKETDAPDNPVRIAFGAIADDRQADFGDTFDCTVVPLYGLTESGGLALSGTVEEPRTGSLGRPTEYQEVAVVDEDDTPVGPGTEGEIIVRPTRPNAMFKRYFEKPEATVEATENQWLHTGDIGYYDENGDYHFVERKSYFIRRMGENVSAFEVERIVEDHPDVADVVVVGADDEVAGQEVFAAVKLEDGAALDPVDIVKHCEGRIAYFKVPQYVAFVDSFPTTETKETVQRFRVVDEYLADAWDRDEAGYQLER
ncbi:AMP-binding protein [Natrinema caseinilyticum]|uniref:AMP-binding protein n=1 Tax=Natrinema caseinilyticum TaxID=2961570 RepID=UPI0020C25668|nr:AMP-binding protein [Natrinema caseinilyticum]